MGGYELPRGLVSPLWRSDGGHFFARPLLDTLMCLVSDSPMSDAMNNAFRLNPRAVAHASAVGLVRSY